MANVRSQPTWLPDDDTLAAWSMTAHDAGIDPTSVHLFVAPSGGDGDYQAMHYAPGMWAIPDDKSFDFSNGLRLRIRELKEEQVLLLATGRPPDLRLLLLRHEAEHVVQDQQGRGVSEVSARIADLFDRAYYQAMPHERDADAAATAYRRRLGLVATDDDLRGPDRKLYDAEWAASDPGSLPIRLLAYTLFNPEGFNHACTSGSPFTSIDPDELLDDLAPGSRRVRSEVGNSFVQRGRDALAHDYDDESWGRLSQTEKNAVLDEIRHRLVTEEQNIVADIAGLLD